MYNDSFKSRYTTIPFATYAGDHRAVAETRATLFHCHCEMEFLVMLEGEAIFHTDGKNYDARAGDILAVSPYLVHATSFPAKARCRHICLCFDLSLLYDRTLVEALETGSAAITPHVQASHPAARTLADSFLQAFAAHAEAKKGWEFAVVGEMSVAFGVLEEHGLITRHAHKQTCDSFCHRAFAYLEAHLADPVTSTDAAESLFLSHGHFCRTFKAQFGYPFGQYLTMLRLERAEHLLRDTDWRISRIAEAVGFESFSYFGKRFREATGMTPSAYRKQHSLLAIHPFSQV